MMAAPLPNLSATKSPDEAIAAACGSIAPSWPLDQAIAVNPWWTMRSQPMSEVAARLSALSGIQMLMPKSWYRAMWTKQITAEHLRDAQVELQTSVSEQDLLRFLATDHSVPSQWRNLNDWLDAHPTHHHKVAWHDEVIQNISQFCGLYFQYPQRMQYLQHMQASSSGDQDFYQAWLGAVRMDRGIEVLMGEPALREQFAKLADDPKMIFAEMFAFTGEHDNFAGYAHALLADINGWASWLAYCAWQDAFDNRNNNLVEQLLAVRMAWDLVLWRHFAEQHPVIFRDIKPRMLGQFERYQHTLVGHAESQSLLWVWQRALELSFQRPIQRQLMRPAVTPSTDCQLQAAFCIDVRSEPMRRALEAQDDAIQTLGFAGFFGLPLEYAPASVSYVRPQLPGLLKPSVRATQTVVTDKLVAGQRASLRSITSHDAKMAAPSTFGLVEALGLGKAYNLLKSSFLPGNPKHAVNQLDSSGLWRLSQDNEELSGEQQINLVAGILAAMGLTSHFAPRVLLLGHGSCSANNPQAAALDCGACGGQTGEVNVKVLAQLLNDPKLRAGLAEKGILIPQQTLFIAGLHNTTTDDITCFDVSSSARPGESELRGESKSNQDEQWQTWVSDATKLAQQQRAASLGMSTQDVRQTARQYSKRSRDWAELRPEWGLANNAGFIVAPRSRSRGIDLGGRCFLHDYQWQQDAQFKVLELIMTAPMIVTNWINLQYYASVTDNQKYGSGNKLLHNVVGGNIGVFEGNGGDLRIGLAKQSLHDGEHWRHQPLRLSVYIAAPMEAMESIINAHQAVADLLNNDWLYLFHLDDEGKHITRYYQHSWRPVETAVG